MKRQKYASGIPLPREADARRLPARRFKALVAAYSSEIGDSPSETDKALIAQAASIAIRIERRQADILQGLDVDEDSLIRLSSEHRRILTSLRTKADKVKPDAPTELDRYLRDKYGPAESEPDEPEAEATP
jgi:hypothetical protein